MKLVRFVHMRILLCIVGFSIVGCKENPEVLEQTTGGNFTLYVNNQSPTRFPIDIELRLDGKLALTDRLHKSDDNRQQYKFQLSQGKHVMTAFSKKGQAKIEQEFFIEDNH